MSERLWGLTEMFPESVRTACEVATDFTISSTKGLYKFSCNASWIFFTSSMILFAPVLFETERAQMVELELSQKQRVSVLSFASMCSKQYFSEWFTLDFFDKDVMILFFPCGGADEEPLM